MNAQERSYAYRLGEEDKKLTYERDTKIPNAGTFILNKEDHTLANLFRMQLLRDKNVKFAGYMHPHPLLQHIVLRIQTSDPPANPIEALSTAIEDLSSEVDTLEQRMKEELENYKQKQDTQF